VLVAASRKVHISLIDRRLDSGTLSGDFLYKYLVPSGLWVAARTLVSVLILGTSDQKQWNAVEKVDQWVEPVARLKSSVTVLVAMKISASPILPGPGTDSEKKLADPSYLPSLDAHSGLPYIQKGSFGTMPPQALFVDGKSMSERPELSLSR
jgi:hypothetical protein